MISKWWIFHVSMLVDWGNMHQPDKKMSSSTESISLHPPDDLLVSNLPI
jgi:hypothetical protein